MATTPSSMTSIPEVLVRGIGSLEPLPVTAQRLFELMRGEDVSLGAIAELIEFDQAVAAAVLREASTVRYAGSGTPTVRDAVLRLGTVAVFNLVLEGYLAKLRTAAPLYDLSEHELWLHGAAAQLAVRAIRAERPRVGIPELADTAAMIHDIGKLIVARHLHVDVQELTARARAKRITFVDAEREVLGTDHAELGAAMAEHWRFPSDIVYAIRHHHTASGITPTPMLDAVVMANFVAKTIETGLGAEGLNFELDPQVERRLGLTFATFGRVCLQTDASLGELTRLHGLSRHSPGPR